MTGLRFIPRTAIANLNPRLIVWILVGLLPSWLSCGHEMGSCLITVVFPSSVSLEQTQNLQLLALEPDDFASCARLTERTAKPGDRGYKVKTVSSFESPFFSELPKIEGIGFGRRLLFAKAFAADEEIRLVGCAEAEGKTDDGISARIVLKWACAFGVCDDNDPCTIDVCDPDKECEHRTDSNRWTLKRQIEIAGSMTMLTDFQIRLMIERVDGMQPDFADLRFRQGQENDLPYWIERIQYNSKAPTAAVWVRVPRIPETGAAIEMYYGNACVLSTSDFDSTFPWESRQVYFGEHIAHISLAFSNPIQRHVAFLESHFVDGNPNIDHAEIRHAFATTDPPDPWTTEIVDPPPGDPSAGKKFQHLSLVLDKTGHPRIAYSDEPAGALRYASWNGSLWSFEAADKTSDGRPAIGTYTSLQLDNDSQPHISYRFENSAGTIELRYASRNDQNSWTAPSKVADPAVGETALSLGADNSPHIAFNRQRPTDTFISVCFTEWLANSWAPVEVVDSQTSYVALALDSQGRPQLAYYKGAPGADRGLKHASRDQTSRDWELNLIDPFAENETPGKFLGIYLDSEQHPHISYQKGLPDGTGRLHYAHWDGKSWSHGPVTQDGDDGYDSSIASDADGFPQISHAAREPGELSRRRYLMFTYRRRLADPPPEVIQIGEAEAPAGGDP